ncbi:hypothetical protein CI610_00029 [invertebrate metagenome]|uniref:Uncharacterized protein n=1 Tax=invertebrate metagenome TaxID=1711999 RepID=A0A2H9TCJ4_9ZZZZ
MARPHSHYTDSHYWDEDEDLRKVHTAKSRNRKREKASIRNGIDEYFGHNSADNVSDNDVNLMNQPVKPIKH